MFHEFFAWVYFSFNNFFANFIRKFTGYVFFWLSHFLIFLISLTQILPSERNYEFPFSKKKYKYIPSLLLVLDSRSLSLMYLRICLRILYPSQYLFKVQGPYEYYRCVHHEISLWVLELLIKLSNTMHCSACSMTVFISSAGQTNIWLTKNS